MAKVSPTPPYPFAAERPDFAAIEQAVLEYWDSISAFEVSVDQRRAAGAAEFVFYDGPPFANGLPHYGHLLTGFVKDAVPRYQTMRGRTVERRFGWDCHGLPAEMGAENELGVHGHAAIADYGVARFNEYCRQSVMRYTQEWRRYVTRAARWVDFDNDYKTMDVSYTESVMWAFKTLFDKGLIYEGYRVVPYSWAAETVLSNLEARLDDSYRERQDPALTVAFTLTPASAAALGVTPSTALLAWTTTPWTLPSNLALAVGPEIEYSVVKLDQPLGEITHVIMSSQRLESYARELGEAPDVVRVLPGSDLVGATYEPLLDYFASWPNSFRVLAADFVSTDDGTGVVHLAPGFGEDDQRVCEAAGISVVCPVDERGRFTAEVPDYADQLVFDANPLIIKALKAQGKVVRHETIVHNYPHCWRTDEPLIYRAVSSWFVKVSAVKDRMLELNEQITWIPAHVRDGAFGKWVENARDWSISRNRFWGSPIPVWKSDDPNYPRVDVYGSLDDIERDFGVRPTDLHRPYVDELTRPNPDDPTGRSTMRRVPEVFDCWFESGSMPFAQVHYPFERREWFESHFPADFIVEYTGQAKAWFYTLHVLSTALFDKPPFRTVVAHGILLGDDGRKLSKKLKNFPDPDEALANYGADAMRWYLLSSPVLRGADIAVDAKGFAESVRAVLLPLWNAFSFFTMYANVDRIAGERRANATGVLDRYALAKTRELVETVTARMDSYDIAGAASAIGSYLDALTNWYIRRSRERFWSPLADAESDKADAYDTLYTCLLNLCEVAAPLLPLVGEHIYRALSDAQSVHLQDWPDPAALPDDPDLVATMDRVRDVCSAALSVRKANKIRVRQPLARLSVYGEGASRLSPYTSLIADELNVKHVELSESASAVASRTITVNPRVAGPRLGGAVQHVLAAAKRGEWSEQPDGSVHIAGQVLTAEECTVAWTPHDGDSSRVLTATHSGFGAAVLVLDLELTDDLVAEGTARDLVRLIQSARKEAGKAVTDRVQVTVSLEAADLEAARTHHSHIAHEVLADSIEFVVLDDVSSRSGTELANGRQVDVRIA